ncbi:hypothetical protein BED42_12780 [Citrobacter portucalensis]|nr:hypothetical protein BED42_12780 [Citrobacter portucalensis]
MRDLFTTAIGISCRKFAWSIWRCQYNNFIEMNDWLNKDVLSIPKPKTPSPFFRAGISTK